MAGLVVGGVPTELKDFVGSAAGEGFDEELPAQYLRAGPAKEVGGQEVQLLGIQGRGVAAVLDGGGLEAGAFG